MPTRYKLYAGGGSPYSMKMRAVLRYRRLPFDWARPSLDDFDAADSSRIEKLLDETHCLELLR